MLSVLEAFDVMDALSGAALLCFDASGRVLRSNAAFRELSDIEHLEQAPEDLRRLLAWPPGASSEHQLRGELQDREGRRRQLGVRVRRLADAYIGLLEDRSGSHARDISRQVELDSVLVGIVTVGPGGIEWMNRSARRMFGALLGDCIGRGIDIVAPPDPEHPLRQAQRLQALREGESENFECQIHALDGREFWIAGNAVITGQGEARRLTYALLDIDRRRQAEAQTEAARASLARIIEAAPMAISLHDARSRRIERINQAAADIAGRAPHELLGARPEALFGPENGARIAKEMERAMLADVGAVIEGEYRSGAGAEQRVWDLRLLHLSGSTEAAAVGDAGQVLLVASDVTAQRAAEAERLREAIAQRELLVREVHHRIKNNLQGVAGLLQQAAARRPEVAGVIHEAVGQVSTIAQVYGLKVGDDGPLRVRHVMEAIVDSVRRMSGRRIRTETETAHGFDAQRWLLPDGDSIPIALALNELLTNAIKHSLTPDCEVFCTLIAHAEGLRLEISNPGRLPPGFDPAQPGAGSSGLSLVRALLPRRGARLSFAQAGEQVLCALELAPPGIALAAPQPSVSQNWETS